MFSNLGNQLAGNTFLNMMNNYGGHTQSLVNTLAATVSATDGLSISGGQTQTVTGVKVTDQRAIGIQIWFKGTFTNNQIAVALSKSASVKSVYIDRNSNDLRLKTTHSGLSFTFSNAVSSMSSSGWIFMGLSVGWMARNNDFMICGYVHQPSSGYESGN